MKNFKFLIILFFLSINSFAQLSKTLYNQGGIIVSYRLELSFSGNDSDTYKCFVTYENHNNYKLFYPNYAYIEHLTFEGFDIGTMPTNSEKIDCFTSDYYIGSLEICYCFLKENQTKTIQRLGDVRVNKGEIPKLKEWSFGPKIKFTEIQKKNENSSSNGIFSPSTSSGWSEWKSFNGCGSGLQYRVEKYSGSVSGFEMRFEVKSSYQDDVDFGFLLLDKKDKIHFGDRRQVKANGTTTFKHGMQGDFIVSFKLDNPYYIKNGKSICENTEQNQQDKELTNNANDLLKQINDKCAVRNKLSSEAQSKYVHVPIIGRCGENYDTGKYGGIANMVKAMQTDLKNLNKDIDDLNKALNKNTENNKKLEEEQKRKAEEEERKRQEEAERQRKLQIYNQTVSQGDAAAAKGDYDTAMQSYQQAINEAPDDSTRNSAIAKLDKAKLDKEKVAYQQNKIKQVQQTDQIEDTAYGTTAAAVVGIMALISDRPSLGKTAGKIQVGLGLEQFPLITNEVNPYATFKDSELTTSLHPTFYLGFNFTIFNTKNLNVILDPKIQYGINAFSKGETGSHLLYGSNVLAYGSLNKEFPLKLYGEAGYFFRNGSYSYDLDTSINSSGSTAESYSYSTDEGEYNYNILSYGGGLMFRKIDRLKEYYFRVGAYFEKPSFFKNTDAKPVLTLKLQCFHSRILGLDFIYSKNYFIGGEALYPNSITPKNYDYWGFRIYRQGRLW